MGVEEIGVESGRGDHRQHRAGIQFQHDDGAAEAGDCFLRLSLEFTIERCVDGIGRDRLRAGDELQDLPLGIPQVERAARLAAQFGLIGGFYADLPYELVPFVPAHLVLGQRVLCDLGHVPDRVRRQASVDVEPAGVEGPLQPTHPAHGLFDRLKLLQGNLPHGDEEIGIPKRLIAIAQILRALIQDGRQRFQHERFVLRILNPVGNNPESHDFGLRGQSQPVHVVDVRPGRGENVQEQLVALLQFRKDGCVRPGDRPIVIHTLQVHEGLTGELADHCALQRHSVANLRRLWIDQGRDDLVVEAGERRLTPDPLIAGGKIIEAQPVTREGAEHGVHRLVVLRSPGLEKAGGGDLWIGMLQAGNGRNWKCRVC